MRGRHFPSSQDGSRDATLLPGLSGLESRLHSDSSRLLMRPLGGGGETQVLLSLWETLTAFLVPSLGLAQPRFLNQPMGGALSLKYIIFFQS